METFQIFNTELITLTIVVICERDIKKYKINYNNAAMNIIHFE